MFHQHTNIILSNVVTKTKDLYCFKTNKDNSLSVTEFMKRKEDVDLINMGIKYKGRHIKISKYEFRVKYLESKNLEDTGIFTSEQVYEEILKEGDLIALYCSVRKLATVFRIDKIRKGFLGFIFGIYKFHNLQGEVFNRDDIRAHLDWGHYTAFPSTRLFRLTEVDVISNI